MQWSSDLNLGSIYNRNKGFNKLSDKFLFASQLLSNFVDTLQGSQRSGLKKIKTLENYL